MDQKRTEIATKHFIPKSYWNSKTGKCKSGYKYAQLLNAYIEKTRNDLNQILLGFSSMRKATEPQDIKNKLLGIEEQPKHKTILDAFGYHNLKMSEQVKIGKVVSKTYVRYIITKNKVEAFMQHQYKKGNISLPEMRLRFVTEFEHYLLPIYHK
ncbi:MAG: hypothetical protein LC101_01585 [Flavobacteriales bacterium]|nr:hypothetical protein [Flavobacteriales bacterium]